MTWQEINEKKLAQIHPILAARVRALIEEMQKQSIAILITQALRTIEEQDALYAQGRTKPGQKITNAPGGHSQHNFGLAVDLCPDNVTLEGLQLDWNVDHPVWKKLLAEAPKFKLAEGAAWRSFPDCPHFYPVEIPATTAELRLQHQAGGMVQVNRWFESLIV